MPLSASVAPVAVMVLDAAADHVREPPATVGAVGLTRSIWTTLPPPGLLGDHGPTFPAPSIARNWTIVWPWAETASEVPVAAAVQLVPPLVEARN